MDNVVISGAGLYASVNTTSLNMSPLIARDTELHEVSVILDSYANTRSAGSAITLHQHQDDLSSRALGVLSSFGADYSIVLHKRR